jgi:hypothetical protein
MSHQSTTGPINPYSNMTVVCERVHKKWICPKHGILDRVERITIVGEAWKDDKSGYTIHGGEEWSERVVCPKCLHPESADPRIEYPQADEEDYFNATRIKEATLDIDGGRS